MHSHPFPFLLSALALTALWRTLPSNAQFIPTPQDFTHATGCADVPVRYKEVPSDVCETTPGVKSFSGYADIGEHEHTFFWFFEARNGDPRNAPLTLWLNGGPGSSSMVGLFNENGPCRVEQDGTLTNNPYSWNNVSNMLYIDQPVGVGLSYSDAVPAYINLNVDAPHFPIVLPGNECPDYARAFGTCGTYSISNVTLTANSSAAATKKLWKAMQGFLGAFPQYAQNGVHLASESYGGHYIPVLSDVILRMNMAPPSDKACPIALKSVTINNGWFDALVQHQAEYLFAAQPGNTYDVRLLTPMAQRAMFNGLYMRGNCVDKITKCAETNRDDVCLMADSFCQETTIYPYLYSGRSVYDVRLNAPDALPNHAYARYLNLPYVQQATGMTTNYSDHSGLVTHAFAVTGDVGRNVRAVQTLSSLIARGVTVTLWAGDADFLCNWYGVRLIAQNIHYEGFTRAGYAALQTSDGQQHGDVKQSGGLSFTRIFQAGHLTPYSQPLASLALFERSIKGLDIATGTVAVTKSYRTAGPPTSSFREGNSSALTTTRRALTTETQQEWQAPPVRRQRNSQRRRSRFFRPLP